MTSLAPSPFATSVPSSVSPNVNVPKVWQPLYGAHLPALTPSTVTQNTQPVDEVPFPVAGVMGHGPNDTFYNKVIMSPSRLDLGSISSQQRSIVYVWNGFFQDITMTSLDGQEEGLSVTGQPTAPLLFKGLEEKQWQISVDLEGPAVIDRLLTWVFDIGLAVGLPVTGRRVVTWALPADWNSPIIERLEWLTSIAVSPLGREQRRKMRLSPRREMKLKSIAKAQQLNFIELLIAENGGRDWAVPFFPHTQFLPGGVGRGSTFISCDTSGVDFVKGELAMLHGANPWVSEVAEISNVSPIGIELTRDIQVNWPGGTKLSPAKVMRFKTQPNINRITDDLAGVDLHFEQTNRAEWATPAGLPMYRGRPILLDKPEESENLTNTYQRLLSIINTPTSLPTSRDTAGVGFTVQAHRWQVYGRAQQARLKAVYYLLSGQWKSIWMPTHYADLTIAATATASDTSIMVEWVGYSRSFASTRLGKRDIQILMRNGQSILRRIEGAAPDDGTLSHEVLSLNSPPGVILSPQTVARISFLTPVRLDQDFVEIHYDTDSEGMAHTRSVFRSVLEEQ